jgi:hypothetical protein
LPTAHRPIANWASKLCPILSPERIANAPMDDEPETEHERVAVAEAIEWFKNNPNGISFEEVLERFARAPATFASAFPMRAMLFEFCESSIAAKPTVDGHRDGVVKPRYTLKTAWKAHRLPLAALLSPRAPLSQFRLIPASVIRSPFCSPSTC